MQEWTELIEGKWVSTSAKTAQTFVQLKLFISRQSSTLSSVYICSPVRASLIHFSFCSSSFLYKVDISAYKIYTQCWEECWEYGDWEMYLEYPVLVVLITLFQSKQPQRSECSFNTSKVIVISHINMEQRQSKQLFQCILMLKRIVNSFTTYSS